MKAMMRLTAILVELMIKIQTVDADDTDDAGWKK